MIRRCTIARGRMRMKLTSTSPKGNKTAARGRGAPALCGLIAMSLRANQTMASQPKQ